MKTAHGCLTIINGEVVTKRSKLLLLLCFVGCTLTWRCTSTNPDTGKKEIYYPLVDTRFKVHKYRENIQWLIFPKNNKRTEYCSVHYVWEDITPIYRKINEEFKYVYRVELNKKSWK